MVGLVASSLIFAGSSGQRSRSRSSGPDQPEAPCVTDRAFPHPGRDAQRRGIGGPLRRYLPGPLRGDIPGPLRRAGRHRAAILPRRIRQGLGAEFWRFTAPRAFQGTFQVVILWLDILLVGAIVSSYAAGVYAAVSKLAMVGTFVLEGNRLAIGPQLSALMARREHDRAAELFQTATRWLMLASWPLYLAFAIFPAVVLGIFGSRYTAGAAALSVLSLAMLVNLGTGNVTVVLLMGGKSSWSAINAGAALHRQRRPEPVAAAAHWHPGRGDRLGSQHHRGQRHRHDRVAVGTRDGAVRPGIRGWSRR